MLPAQLHPLVHRAVPGDPMRFASTFSGEEFFFRDHTIAGKRTLPAVAYLEMAREAAKHGADDRAGPAPLWQLSDVLWVAPLVVATGCDTACEVGITLAATSADKMTFSVTSHSAGGEATLHSRGRIRCIARAALTTDLAALRRKCSDRGLSPAEHYESFAAVGIHYGDAFRAVAEVHTHADSALATLHLPACVLSTHEDFVLHPSLMDSALQAIMSLARRAEARPGEAARSASLPFAMDRVEVFGRPAPLSQAWIRYSHELPRSDSPAKIDIDLCDDSGTVSVRIAGFRVRGLRAL
jgi:polyketide synthase PksN